MTHKIQMYKDSKVFYEWLKGSNSYLIYILIDNEFKFIGDIDVNGFNFTIKGKSDLDYTVLTELSILTYRYANKLLKGQENYTI